VITIGRSGFDGEGANAWNDFVVAAINVPILATGLVVRSGIRSGIEHKRAHGATDGLVVGVHLVEIGILDRASGLGLPAICISLLGGSKKVLQFLDAVFGIKVEIRNGSGYFGQVLCLPPAPVFVLGGQHDRCVIRTKALAVRAIFQNGRLFAEEAVVEEMNEKALAPVEKELTAAIADGFYHRAIFLRIGDLLGDDFEVNSTAYRLKALAAVLFADDGVVENLTRLKSSRAVSG
jgi:hypothetical protein